MCRFKCLPHALSLFLAGAQPLTDALHHTGKTYEEIGQLFQEQVRAARGLHLSKHLTYCMQLVLAILHVLLVKLAVKADGQKYITEA